MAYNTKAAAVESLVNVIVLLRWTITQTKSLQANPRLATKRDDDERLPIHWAVSYNHMPVVELLVSRRDFDPDVQVLSFLRKNDLQILLLTYMQDASGWTPLMIAASLREGDDLVDMLLSKEAEVNVKSRTFSCH